MASNFRVYNGNTWQARMSSMRSRITPCPCGISLQTGAKIVACVQMAISALFIVGVIILLITVASLSNSTEDDTTVEHWKHKLGVRVILAVGTVLLLILVLLLVLHTQLYLGVKHRNYRKVHFWWVVFLICTGVVVLTAVVNLIEGKDSLGGFELLDTIFDIYCLWVIYEYKKQLLQEPLDPTVEFERVV